MVHSMQGRIGRVLAALALAVGGGVAGAVVVAPSLHPPSAELTSLSAEQAAAVEEAGREARASLRHTFKVAKKARGMARGARQLANGLSDQLNQLSTQVNQVSTQTESALTQAGQAFDRANTANSRLDATKVASDVQAAQVTTASTTDYVPAGGPQVTATVPESGFIEVYSTVTFGEDGNSGVAADGAVALFEDGQKVPIASDPFFGLCTDPDLDGPILVAGLDDGEEITLSTPPAYSPLGCGVLGGAPGALLLKRPPGTHVYELRYADSACGCSTEPAAFSDRVLRIAPRL